MLFILVIHQRFRPPLPYHTLPDRWRYINRMRSKIHLGKLWHRPRRRPPSRKQRQRYPSNVANQDVSAPAFRDRGTESQYKERYPIYDRPQDPQRPLSRIIRLDGYE